MSNTVRVNQVGLTEVKATPTGQVLKLTFPLTQRFAVKFGWPELPDITKKWAPAMPPVVANWIEFVPADPSLQNRAFRLECHGTITNFEVIRKAAKGKDAKKSGQKLTDVTASVGFVDEDLTKVVAYMKTTLKSGITLSYDPTPVQAELDPDYDPQPELEGATVEQPSAEEEEFTQADETAIETPPAPVKRGRGRPRKNPVV